MAATVGRLAGVGAVLVDVPTPIRRPAEVVQRAAAVGTVVVAVTGRVRVEVVTGRGRLGGAGGGGSVVKVVVGAGSVPTPATGGTLNTFKAVSTSMG